jgi:hypothetical protein
MAKSSSNTRTFLIIGIAAFLGGCWVGMGSDSSGSSYCVVTDATASMHPGVAPGQLADKPATGCVPGEPEVCGSWAGSDDERHFVSDQCPDDD